MIISIFDKEIVKFICCKFHFRIVSIIEIVWGDCVSILFFIPAEDLSDQEYFVQIYGEFEKLIYATAKKYISNPTDCEDVVQDSILALIRKVKIFRTMNRYSLTSYIICTIRNTSINYLIKQKRIQLHSIPLDDGEAACQDKMEEQLQILDYRNQLSAIWNKLPSENRFLLEGKYIIGYSDRELANQLSCKPSSIRMMLTRARRKAFKLLKQQEDSE